MAEELTPLDISRDPRLRRLVEEVRASNRPLVLQIDHRDVAILAPPPAPDKESRAGNPTNGDDPLWRIVGLVDSGGPGDISERVDDYLAAVNAPNQE